MQGVFIEHADDRHLPLRERLGSASDLRDWPEQRCAPEDFPRRLGGDLSLQLREDGVLCVALDRPLSTPEFLAVGACLGQKRHRETDPAVAPFVEDEVVLNIVSRFDATADVAIQPFSVGRLNMHTEGSGKALDQQPRYIMLMCCEPGDAATTSPTILAPMTEVTRHLTRTPLSILLRTRYQRNREGPTIARRLDTGVVFSFRDFGSEPLDWTYDGGAVQSEDVRDAIESLLTATYKAANWRVIWRPGLLIIIDNWAFFHGKAEARTISNRPRHLKRLRIS